ncbi:MAG: vitamin K epoxide reductase family protein [Actinomycetota bacterium]
MTTDAVAADEEAGDRIPRARDARHRGAYVEMLISSVLGLIAALVLSIDAIVLAADPNAALSCNVSETISCAKVGITWQANLLGWPNSFLGLIAEPVVITVAVAGLGGVRFPRWFMNTAMVFYSVGLVFAYWLFYEAYFVIGALCPWCLLVTVTTTTVFLSLLRVNLADNTFRLPERAFDRVQFLLRIGADIWLTILLIAIMAAMVIFRYL